MNRKTALFFILTALATGAKPAHATLGEGGDTVDRDMKSLGGKTHTSTDHHTYSIEEITTDYGVVREYLATNGKIFGLAWNGQAHPDLSPLLGNYFDDFHAGEAKHRHKPGRRKHQITTNNMILERHGHMRKVAGCAFDKSLLPEGVSANDIK